MLPEEKVTSDLEVTTAIMMIIEKNNFLYFHNILL